MRNSIAVAILLLLPVSMHAADSGIPGGFGRVMSPGESARVSDYAPQPDYPVEARRHRLQGTGFFVVRVDMGTGSVKSVRVARGTGHKILDAWALKTLRTWRFKPNELAIWWAQDAHSQKSEFALFLVPVVFVMTAKT